MTRLQHQGRKRSPLVKAINNVISEKLESRTLFAALTSAQTITSSIGAAGEIDTYTISGVAGGSFLATVAETVSGSSLSPRIELYSPSNALLTSAQGTTGTDTNTISLPTTGTYTVKIKDAAGTGTGGYALTAVSIGPGIAQDSGGDGGTVQSGETRSATIGVGDVDVFTINGVAGGSFLANVGETVSGSSLTPQIAVYAPSGALMTFNQNAVGTLLGSVATPTTGTYTVLVRDYTGTGTGTYAVTSVMVGAGISQNAGGDGGSTTSAETKTANVGIGDIDVFTISGVAGGSFLAAIGETTAGSSLTPQIIVYSPSGSLLSYNQNAVGTNLGTIAEATTGTYFVVVRDYTGTGSGGYAMTAVSIGTGISQNAGGDGGAIGSGVTKSSAIAIGDIDVFTISGVAGGAFQAAVGESVAGSVLTPQIALYSPSGALLTYNQNAVGTNLGSIALAVTGTYTVLVRDYNGTGTGTYAMTPFMVGPGITQNSGGDGGTVQSAETRTATIGVGDIDVFTLNGVAGGSILASIGETVAGSTLTPQIGIYTPAGVLMTYSQNATGTLLGGIATPTTGVYTVVVRDYNGTGTGTYAMTAVTVGLGISQNSGGDGGFIASGVQRNASLGMGDEDVHPFYAVAGDKIALTMTESVAGSTLTPQMALYSPAGALLTYSQNASSVSLLVNSAATSGIYFILTRDYNGTGTGSYKLDLIETPSATKPTITNSATDPLAAEPGPDTGTFTVTRTNIRALPVTVFYTIGGSATANVDYNTLGGSVVIQPNQASATITVTAKTDVLTEANETVITNLSANAAYIVGAPNSATVNIAPSGTGKISGTVYDDANANGIIDAGEAVLGSRRLFVDLNNDNIWQVNERSILTSASGAFEFANLPTGTFRVRQVAPTGTRATFPAAGFYDVTLAAGQIVTARNFATTTRSLFSGFVFKDQNSNKLKDAGELGLSGWKVFIDLDNDNTWDSTESFVLTDATGAFKFSNLAAGTYKFVVVAQTGYTRTTPTSFPLSVALSAAQVKTDGLFGYHQP